jgi:hypothetical protein
MEGVARYFEWRQQFLSNWQESIMKGQIKQAWAKMPPEMKEALKENDPEGYQSVIEIVQGDKDHGYS